MSDLPTERAEGLRELSEVTAGIGVTLLRDRDFLGKKVARQFMEELNLVLDDDEEGNHALEDVLGTGVSTGIVLGMRHATTQEEIDEQVVRLTNGLPEGLRSSIGRLLPFLIQRGVDFHRDEMVAEGPLATQWGAEFLLMQAADPQHEHWEEID